MKAKIRQLLCDARKETHKESEPEWYVVRDEKGQINLVNQPTLCISSMSEAKTECDEEETHDVQFNVGDSVQLDNVNGQLICSSKMGLQNLDVFNHVMTDEKDLRSFLGDNNCNSMDKAPSLAIKSYLKFCSLTETPQWQVDSAVVEAESGGMVVFEFDSDEEVNDDDFPWAKKRKRSDPVEDKAIEEAILACCPVCHPNAAFDPWPPNVKVGKIGKFMSNHLKTAHDIEDSFYRDYKHKSNELALLDDRELKRTFISSSGPVFKCKLCPYESHPSPESQTLPRCSVSEQQYTMAVHLRYHADNQTNVEFSVFLAGEREKNSMTHKCHDRRCNYTFKTDCYRRNRTQNTFWPYSVIAYSRHWVEKHQDAGLFTCDQCGSTFVTKLSFEEHIAEMHDSSFKVQCVECGKMCLSESKLKSHIRYHKKTKPCEICGEDCKSQTTYDAHMVRVHGGARKYKCGYCPATFIHSNHKNRHVKQFHGSDSDPSRPISIRTRGPNRKNS